MIDSDGFPMPVGPTSLEICAGAGGQALGLEQAGFRHVALVEVDPTACATLRKNRPEWNVLEQDVHLFSPRDFAEVDLLAAGVPCPPFSKAGRQLGAQDERDLFPELLRIVDESRPRAIMVENVRGILDPVFHRYRRSILSRLDALGYAISGWRLLNASDFGVPQLRPRAVLVAFRKNVEASFEWPSEDEATTLTVGSVLLDLMNSNGWEGAKAWAAKANRIAPTLVGGSKKHGGPDLGPTRAKRAWEGLCVDAMSIAEEPPPRDFVGMPRLTVPMAALLQGFPLDWAFCGRKTAAYRQVGNAFPPPVARAVGLAIRRALAGESADSYQLPKGSQRGLAFREGVA